MHDASRHPAPAPDHIHTLSRHRVRASLSAETMRFGMRMLLLKKRIRPSTSLATVRRQLKLVSWLVPRPPRGTKISAIDAGGVPAERIATPASRPDRHILYLHGGAFLTGFPALYRDMTWRLAKFCRAQVTCVDYRLAPEHPFPAGLDDCVTAYRWLIASGADPARIAVMGDSAGGGLVFATLLRLRDEGVPLPAVAVAVSPWTDLALTGDSLRLNAEIDPLIPIEAAPRAVELYLAGADPRDPYASPIYGDQTGLPPSLILVGGDDVLRDDAVRMAERMRAAGCDAEVEVWPRMWHVWHMLARILPEGRAAVARLTAFADARMG
jgi:epsilon-lactone hydrolase